mmetsp:Transcript_13467/g.42978  ORF Transcript_13467/g.42978 Transcript_13467/m.42978 type:complete len:281 (-) Transcript_13467:996-1838(-)
MSRVHPRRHGVVEVRSAIGAPPSDAHRVGAALVIVAGARWKRGACGAAVGGAGGDGEEGVGEKLDRCVGGDHCVGPRDETILEPWRMLVPRAAALEEAQAAVLSRNEGLAGRVKHPRVVVDRACRRCLSRGGGDVGAGKLAVQALGGEALDHVGGEGRVDCQGRSLGSRSSRQRVGGPGSHLGCCCDERRIDRPRIRMAPERFRSEGSVERRQNCTTLLRTGGDERLYRRRRHLLHRGSGHRGGDAGASCRFGGGGGERLHNRGAVGRRMSVHGMLPLHR